MQTTLYGLKPSICDTMKKAVAWLTDNDVEFTLHDYRKEGAPEALIQEWIDRFGWEKVINKRGTTWRTLDADIKDTMDNSKALACIMKNPAMIKRPFLNHNGNILIGFSVKEYETLYSK